MPRLWFAIGLIFTKQLLFSQQVLSLPDLIQATLDKNVEVQIANKKAELKNLQFNKQASLLKPQVNLSGSYFHYWDDVPNYVFPNTESQILSPGILNENLAVPLGLRNNYLVDLSIRQRIFDFQFIAANGLRQDLKDLQQSELLQIQEDAITELCKAYFRLKLLDQQSRSIDFNKSRLEKLLAIVTSRIANDMAPALDSAKLTKLMNGLILEEQRLQQGRILTHKNIVRISGIDTNTTIDTNFEFSFQEVSQVSGSSNQQLIDGATKLKQSQLANEKTVNPTLDLFASLALQGQSDNITFSNDAFNNNIGVVGLQMNLPIWNGGASVIKKQELKTEIDILELQKKQLLQGEELESQKLKGEIDFLGEKINLEERWILSLDEIIRQTESKWNEGLVGINELLEIEAERIQAQQELASIQFDLATLRMEYLRLQGNLISSLTYDKE